MNNEYSRILGIDFGSVRIELSVSDPMKIIAQGFKTIKNDKESITEILSVIASQNIEKIVIGNPLNLKGEVSSKAEEVNEFVKKLKESIPLEIILLDERFTSVMAQRSIITMGTKKKQRQNNKGKIDEVAAAILLQGYLDSQRR